MKAKIKYQELKGGQERILQLLIDNQKLSPKQTIVYSIDDLAKLFSVTKRTIYNWKDEGRFDYVVIGSKTYVTEDQLNKFLNNHAVASCRRGGINHEC